MCGEKQPLCRYWLSLDAVLHHWLHSAGRWVDELFWLRGFGLRLLSVAAGSRLHPLDIHFCLSLLPIGKDKKKTKKTSLSQTARQIPWSVVFCNNFTNTVKDDSKNTLVMSRSPPPAVILGFSTYPLCQDLLKNEQREVQLPTFMRGEANVEKKPT